jgi:tetratricopeptide (TPR) repeat protein
MANGQGGNGSNDWDSFDWTTWGESAAQDGSGGLHERNGFAGASDGRPAGEEEAGEEAGEHGEGRWVSQGGVLHWETPGDEDEADDPRAEASSRWANDDVDLPLGVPDGARIRAAHAWLVRRRALEAEAQGVLLLERRNALPQEEDEEPRAQARRGPPEDSPWDVALAEHQAAIEEYERLIEELDEIADHSGPARALVEYYLALTERLAELARRPEARAELAERLLLVPVEDEEAASGADGSKRPPTPREEAEWRGRAEAVLQARRRVERVSAPEPEE